MTHQGLLILTMDLQLGNLGSGSMALTSFVAYLLCHGVGGPYQNQGSAERTEPLTIYLEVQVAKVGLVYVPYAPK